MEDTVDCASSNHDGRKSRRSAHNHHGILTQVPVLSVTKSGLFVKELDDEALSGS